MDAPFVPKHGPRPLAGQTCGYAPGRDAAECGQPATWHVAWDGPPTLDNSLTCDEHMGMVVARWVFDDRHELCADCTMPGALWMYRDRCCRVPGTPEPAVATAVAGAAGETG